MNRISDDGTHKLVAGDLATVQDLMDHCVFMARRAKTEADHKEVGRLVRMTEAAIAQCGGDYNLMLRDLDALGEALQ